MVFQLVRNTTAIWRNAARYCWFKMDLFVSKLYIKPARETEREEAEMLGDTRERRFCFHSPPPHSQSAPASYAPGGRPCRRNGALEEQQRPGRKGALPERSGGDGGQAPARKLRADGLCPRSKGGGQGRRHARKSQADGPLGLPSRQA